MRIVHAQREAMDEFKELTAEAVKLRPPECDTEFRVEVEGEMVPLTIYLPEEPFDFRRYRKATDRKARMALKQERQEQLRKSQSQVAQDIEELGGHIASYEYITNVLDVDVPICTLDKVASLPGVLGVEKYSDPPVPTSVNGAERRLALGLPSAGHSIFTGVFGSTRSNGSRIRFGVIESRFSNANALNVGHLSFNQSSNGVSRIVSTGFCKRWSSGNRCDGSATGSIGSHGTRVTSILLSDFSRDQSPTINGTARHMRSGIAPRATARYYSILTWEDVRTAVREASLEDGVDVINMSIGSSDDSTWCSTPTLSGTRAAFEAAVDAGVVPVVSAGNNGHKSVCNVNPTGTYTSTISVGGTTDATSLSTLDAVSRFVNIPAEHGSSYGKVNAYPVGSGVVAPTSLVTVMANYNHRMMAGGGTIGTDSGGGTSYAAPSVASIVGLIKHWIWYRGGLPQGMHNDPLAIRAILSLMGDGRAPHGSSSTMMHVDDEFGFGNVRFVNLDTDIGSEGSWGIKKITVSKGSTIRWDINDGDDTSTNVQGFKAVVLADEFNRNNSPHLEFSLLRNCGYSYLGMVTAAPSALEWRLRIPEPFVYGIIQDECLTLEVKAISAKKPTTLYVAWLLFSNDRIYHDTNTN